MGLAVSIDNDILVAGAPGQDSEKGSVFMFKKDEGGINNWGLIQEIQSSETTAGDYFGDALGFGSNVLAVGFSTYMNELGIQGAGTCLLYSSEPACQDILYVSSENITTNRTYMASSEINLSDVNINLPGSLTLTAPTISINSIFEMEPGTTLHTIQLNGCEN